MENLYGIIRLIDNEFGEMVRNGRFRNKEDIELVYKMIDIVKDIYCVWDYESKMDRGYSEYSNYPMNTYYNDNGNSYARGRSMPRNSMGQFTSRDSSYRGVNYSRADAKSNFIDQLYTIVQNAPDEHLREKAQMMIHEMEQQ